MGEGLGSRRNFLALRQPKFNDPDKERHNFMCG
jgi:hypothetical protein